MIFKSRFVDLSVRQKTMNFISLVLKFLSVLNRWPNLQVREYASGGRQRRKMLVSACLPMYVYLTHLLVFFVDPPLTKLVVCVFQDI